MRVDGASWINFIASNIVITDEGKTRLFDFVTERKFTSSKELRERITTIIWVVNFTNFNGVIRKEIVNKEGKILRKCVEMKHFAVMIKELLLRCNLASTKSFLHIFLHIVVSGTGYLHL